MTDEFDFDKALKALNLGTRIKTQYFYRGIVSVVFEALLSSLSNEWMRIEDSV